MPKNTPSNELDTVAYAISFCDAAAMVANGEDWGDNAPMVVPFYMLIGFSVENCLKAVLEHRNEAKSKNWLHSHDLTHLRILADREDLSVDGAIVDFIDHLSPMHKQHQFRYPQKAATVRLPKPKLVLELTNELLTSAFHFVGGPARIQRQ